MHRTDLAAAGPPRPLLEVVVPVFDEERDLVPNVLRLRRFLDANIAYPALVTIADNASTDGTAVLGRRLAEAVKGVEYRRLERKGRGSAVRETWLASQAHVVAYTDVDLSTDLAALPGMVRALVEGRAEIAIGSRLLPGATVRRGLRREVISRAYNLLLRTALDVRVRDAQCGFKAMRSDAARQLLPQVESEGWFFDTELLVRAADRGLRILESPVHWTDDPDSRVRVIATALEDVAGVWRLLRDPTRRREGNQAGGAARREPTTR